MENNYYIGLDVHKETVTMSVFLNWNQEPEFEKKLNNDHGKLIDQLRRLEKSGSISVCYEAGCLGFTLKRVLDEAGIECRIIAPGKMPRKQNNKIKTDKRDARNLAKLIRNGEAEEIYVPTREDEATRDFIRARDDVKLELKRVKQQILGFLLRLGFRFETNSYWTRKHRQWMKSLVFPCVMHHETLQAYYARLVDLEERLALMDEKIVEISQTDKYTEGVSLLRCFKGVDYLTALSFMSEIGDFKRFPDAGAFMSYLGLIPRENSSGDKRYQGGITKTGNSHLRRLLTESSWHYRYGSSSGRRLTMRRMGQKTEAVAYADKALRRLNKKFIKMLFKGKHKNVVVCAISRELAGFIWGMMNNKIA